MPKPRQLKSRKKERKPESFEESQRVAQQGGRIAGNTRKEIEVQTGKNIISPLNAKEHLQLDDSGEKKNDHQETPELE